MFLKICGIRSLNELELVEKYADATGVVVESNSKRKVEIERAREIIESAEIPVFVVSTCESLNGWIEILEKTEAEFLQVHGDLPPEDFLKLKELGVRIAKVFVVRKTSSYLSEATRILERMNEYEADLFILDSGAGSGKTHDWRVSKLVSERKEIVLAGGLTPENVRKAVEFVKPFGVDVSSGVERNGVKDGALIRKFVEALK